MGDYLWGVVSGSLFGISIMVLIMSVNVKDAYKQGQIDVINGKIKYELVKQSNGSTEWEKIDVDKD